MSSRSLNKVILIGNLTRDPELRYTPSGTAVCTFGLATNRSWTTQSGEMKEDTEFHRIVAWNKLAELCSQLLSKGRKVYVEGRLSTRTWTASDNTQKTTTEIVIEDMIILDSRKQMMAPRMDEGMMGGASMAPQSYMMPPQPQQMPPQVQQQPPQPEAMTSDQGTATSEGAVVEETTKKTTGRRGKKEAAAEEKKDTSEEINPDDIPF